jgi:hypothetical protein
MGALARGIGLVAIMLAACFAEETAQGADVLVDGGFESPSIRGGGYATFASGQAISAWLVVGPGRVAVVDGGFVRAGIQFVPGAGRQWLDLAGIDSRSASGVQQVVQTTPGRSYRLQFKVGNVVNPDAGCGTRSTVHVHVNGARVMSATNGEGSPDMLSWKDFRLLIVATTTRTTISFLNGDPADDGSNGLDAVSLTPVTPDED